MKIVILDKTVKQNIEKFRQFIQHKGQKRKQLLESIEKGCRAYLNSKTGELNFEGEKESYSKEWKVIVIQLDPEKEGAFDVVGEGEDSSFDLSILKEDAFKIFSQTLCTLNQLAYHPKYVRDRFWILRQISNVEFILSDQEQGERNLVHDTWYNIDRYGAETLLSDKPIGTYLFRKDLSASWLEDMLNVSSLTPITCLTLNYCDEEEKISEKTLVKVNNKWLFYNDDPTLSSEKYDTVKQLLENEAKMLTRPLSHRRAA